MLDAGEHNTAADLAARVGVRSDQLLEDPNAETDTDARRALVNEIRLASLRIADALGDNGRHGDLVKALRNRLVLDEIRNVVVIYAENRSFDNLFGLFPGANGLRTRTATSIVQIDRDGSTVLTDAAAGLGGLTAAGQTPVVTQAETTGIWPNAPFQIDTPNALKLYGYAAVSSSVITRDLYHRFFENIMQIDGGKNDQFVAWGDSGGLVMGYFDASQLVCGTSRATLRWRTISFRARSAARSQPPVPRLRLCANGVGRIPAAANPSVATPCNTSQRRYCRSWPQRRTGPVGAVGPRVPESAAIWRRRIFRRRRRYCAVNTMQPPYQPSGNAPVDAAGSSFTPIRRRARPSSRRHRPILVTCWAPRVSAGPWYASGWAAAVADRWDWDPTGSAASTTTIYRRRAPACRSTCSGLSG